MGSRFVTPYFTIKKLRRVKQNGVERSDFMKRIKLKFTYEITMWMDDSEYEETKKRADTGEGEKEIKNMLDDELLAEDGREESSKLTEFYFGMDEEWQ